MRRKSSSSKVVQLPTEAELEILAILWQYGPGTVRDVHTLSNKATGYTTVLKQMQMMAEKGLLARNELHRSHVYEPLVEKEQTQQRLAGNLLQRAFGGSAKNLVLGALSAKKVSAAELKEIREILEEFEKGAR